MYWKPVTKFPRQFCRAKEICRGPGCITCWSEVLNINLCTYDTTQQFLCTGKLPEELGKDQKDALRRISWRRLAKWP